jgi:hypothetical protein
MYCGNKVIEQIPEKMVLFKISRETCIPLKYR